MSCQSKGCGGCGACCGGLRLSQAEIDLLLRLAQIPFLPVARQAGSGQPVCLEAELSAPGEVLTALWQKGLLQLDYDLPLLNFDYRAYAAYPHRGSMALTARGQQVAEQLEIQGIEAER